jgi:hypothetical protein
VSNAVRGDGQHAGIGQFNLCIAQRGRVAVVGGFDIVNQHFANGGQCFKKCVENPGGFSWNIVDRFCIRIRCRALPAERNGPLQLRGKQGGDFVELFFKKRFQLFVFLRSQPREHDANKNLQRFDHLISCRIVPENILGMIRVFG